MKILQTLLYLVSGFYSVALFLNFLSYLWGNKCVKDISKIEAVNKYTTLLLLLCLIVVPLDLHWSIISKIPEETYTVNGILEIDGDDNDYSIPVNVSYYVHEDYDDEGLSAHYTVFFLSDVTPPAQINIPDFTFERLENLPEYVRSNETYEINLSGWFVEGYDDRGDPIMADGYVSGWLSIPPLTKENLGITIEDQMQSIRPSGYIVPAVLVISAIVCLLLLKADNYWKKQK